MSKIVKQSLTLWYLYGKERLKRSVVDEIGKSVSTTCGELKKELAEKTKGGYNKKDYINNVRVAHERSQQGDLDPNHFIPVAMSTKLYRLTGEIYRVIGKDF